jgi:multidrug efflux pump subunit AcrB
VPQLFYQLRKKLDDIAPTLPAGVRGPQVNDEYGDVDTVMYAVTGDGADYHVLDKVVQTLRQRLLAVQDVIKVDVYGDQGRRIFVELAKRLASLAIQLQASSVARQANAINDAGVFETSPPRRVQVTSRS